MENDTTPFASALKDSEAHWTIGSCPQALLSPRSDLCMLENGSICRLILLKQLSGSSLVLVLDEGVARSGSDLSEAV
jgi:hypothetical protein